MGPEGTFTRNGMELDPAPRRGASEELTRGFDDLRLNLSATLGVILQCAHEPEEDAEIPLQFDLMPHVRPDPAGNLSRSELSRRDACKPAVRKTPSCFLAGQRLDAEFGDCAL